MTERRAPNPFDDIPDLVAPAPVVRPAAPQPVGGPVLPPIEAPSAQPSEPPGPIDFGAAFDLDMPRPAAVPQIAAYAPPHAAPSGAPQAPPSYAPTKQAPPLAPASSPGLSGAPVPSAPPSRPGSAAPSSNPHAVPSYFEAPGDGSIGEEEKKPRAPIVTREQIQDAARRAGEVGREVAGKTRDLTVAAALRSVGHNQEKSIRLEDPSTWVKPMLGPIVSLGVAIVFTIIAMVAGVSWLRYIAIACVLGAIGFGVVRWFKLQADN
ncbi:MAG: hypothetical protein U0414_07890 [Polyangiaceae bacterium]